MTQDDFSVSISKLSLQPRLLGLLDELMMMMLRGTDDLSVRVLNACSVIVVTDAEDCWTMLILLARLLLTLLAPLTQLLMMALLALLDDFMMIVLLTLLDSFMMILGERGWQLQVCHYLGPSTRSEPCCSRIFCPGDLKIFRPALFLKVRRLSNMQRVYAAYTTLACLLLPDRLPPSRMFDNLVDHVL